MNSYSIYLHIPFCRHRCGYCDFNTYAGMEDKIHEYVSALCTEIASSGHSAGRRLPVHTVFFGGGTPSLLPAIEVERVFDALQSAFNLLPDAEITLEANPGTLTPDYLRALRGLGINRISLGMQSANPSELQLLERQHGYLDVVNAVKWARRAGFDNLSLDLIFGLPEQRMETWQRTVELALNLAPEHLSVYSLTMEHDTPFGHWAERGVLSEPDPDDAAEMYEWAAERLAQEGHLQYEISNWAHPNVDGHPLACRHNLQYWRNLPYLGFGAGAHGYAAQVRTANVLAPAAYIRRLSKPETAPDGLVFPRTAATQSAAAVDREAEIGETMMMGLRLVREGVSSAAFERRFGERLENVFPDEISDLVQVGLLEWAGEAQETLRLTTKGRLLGNQVFYRFI